MTARSARSADTTSAPYPARSIARTSEESGARAGSSSTRARSVARLTSAARTPATPRSASSTLATHDAHVIPVTTSSRRSTPSSTLAGFVATVIALRSYPLPGGGGSSSSLCGRESHYRDLDARPSPPGDPLTRRVWLGWFGSLTGEVHGRGHAKRDCIGACDRSRRSADRLDER